MANPLHLPLPLLVRGFQISRMLRLVAQLGIADALPDGRPVPVAALAADAGVLAQPLLRVLRALAAFGVFEVDGEGRVGHTPLSLQLRRDAPDTQHYAALAIAGPGSWAAWEHLDAALSGDVPHLRAWQQSRFDYLGEHPQEGRSFDRLMSRGAASRHRAVAASYDFGAARHILDVGGGDGGLLRAVLAASPGPTGTVFDRQDVVAAASRLTPPDPRLAFEVGDFFEGVPSGADVYLLARVLHDWPDDAAQRILARCHAAMTPDARLLVIETLLPEDPAEAEPMDYLSDMQMMAMFGQGRERTQGEFEALLASAGLEVLRVIDVASSVSLLECARV